MVTGEKKAFNNNDRLSHTWLHSHNHLNQGMVRKLKYHEQKLLKKVDFLNVLSLFCSIETPFTVYLVEARCKSTRNKGNETISHTR